MIFGLSLLELLFGIATPLLLYAAWEDYKYREYEMSAFIILMLLAIPILYYSLPNMSKDDFMVLALFLIVSGVLLLFKKLGLGDFVLVIPLVLSPFNFTVSLIFASLIIIPFLVLFPKLTNQPPIIKEPMPFLTIMLFTFILITTQMWLTKDHLFWHVCLDLEQNTETFHCTFIGIPETPTYEMTETPDYNFDNLNYSLQR